MEHPSEMVKPFPYYACSDYSHSLSLNILWSEFAASISLVLELVQTFTVENACREIQTLYAVL
jgi:hypothetical protein